jgi:hypothetical protein
MGDYSRLLTKMEELQSISAEYDRLTRAHMPAFSVEIRGGGGAITGYTDKYSPNDNKNAISNTPMPLVIRPGEDYGEFWKYIGKVTDDKTGADATVRRANSARKCWNLAAGNPRLFQKVVYTGIDNTSEPLWNNNCYGLVPDAPRSAWYETPSPGYVTMVGNDNSYNVLYGNNYKGSGIYTKLGIKETTGTIETGQEIVNRNSAMRINDLQERINGLSRDIATQSQAGINNELDKLVRSAADSDEIIGKINNYMNDAVGTIKSESDIAGKRKEISNLYADINEQTTLRSRKYKFIFYVVITIMIILGYWSYTSELSLLEQSKMVQDYFVGWDWWTYWWMVATVVILFIVSTIGWDIKGYIITAMNYASNPDFWTGQLWWVGVSFLMLIVIFFYATFKSFFSGIGDGMMNAVNGEIGGSGGGGGGEA